MNRILIPFRPQLTYHNAFLADGDDRIAPHDESDTEENGDDDDDRERVFLETRGATEEMIERYKLTYSSYYGIIATADSHLTNRFNVPPPPPKPLLFQPPTVRATFRSTFALLLLGVSTSVLLSLSTPTISTELSSSPTSLKKSSTIKRTIMKNALRRTTSTPDIRTSPSLPSG
jgi:hypothetical protein